MPSKELVANKTESVLLDQQKKKQSDCEFMYDLLNKTLNDAVNAKSQKTKYENDINNDKLNSSYNMNIAKCDGFKEYNNALKERDITYRYIDGCYNYNWVEYRPLEKKLEVFGR